MAPINFDMITTRAVILSGAKDLTTGLSSHKELSVINTLIARSLVVFATRDDTSTGWHTQGSINL
jgi:hypothetical protein